MTRSRDADRKGTHITAQTNNNDNNSCNNSNDDHHEYNDDDNDDDKEYKLGWYSETFCSLTTTIFQGHRDDQRDFQERFFS